MLDEDVKGGSAQVPAPPAFLPEALKNKWVKAYANALEEAKNDHPGDPSAQKQAALREANRILRVPVLKEYADAAKLPDWQVIKRDERDGKLSLVTIDGHKYSFSIPPAKAAAKNSDGQAPPPAAA